MLNLLNPGTMKKKNGDDPRDTPPPTIYGERIDSKDICCVRNFFVITTPDCLIRSFPLTLPDGTQESRVSVKQYARFFAQFEAEGDCVCSCCEFRQYVRGGFWVDGFPLPLILFQSNVGGVPVTVFIDENEFREDGAGNRNFRYGHRADNQDPHDLYLGPDRPTGCFYLGTDNAGITARPGFQYRIQLEFRSYITDTCRQITEIANVREWEVRCEGTT